MPLSPARADRHDRFGAASSLAHDLGYLLWRTGKLSTKVARQALAELGVSARQYAVMAYCAEHGPLAQRAISDALDLDPSATVAVLDSLEQAGYVERRADPNDRRVRLIGITRTGRTFLTGCKREVNRATALLLADLSHSDQAALEVLLQRILLANQPDALPTLSATDEGP